MRYFVIYDKDTADYKIQRKLNTLEYDFLPERYDSYIHASRVCDRLNKEDIEST